MLKKKKGSTKVKQGNKGQTRAEMKQNSIQSYIHMAQCLMLKRRPHEEAFMKLSSFMGKIPQNHALLPVWKLYHEIKHWCLSTFGQIALDSYIIGI